MSPSRRIHFSSPSLSCGLTLLSLAVTMGMPALRANTLNAGDIVVLQMNPSTTDQFVLVPLVNLDPGTTFSLTDNGWLSSSGNGFRTGEGIVVFTTPAGGIRAGTALNWVNGGTLPAGFSSGSGGSANNPTNFALNASNDSLVIVRGNAAVISGTTNISEVLYGLQSDSSSPYAWDASASSATTSARPQLADTNLTPVMQGVNGFYSGAVTATSQATWITRVSNTANWTYSATTQTPLSASSYSVISDLSWTATGSTTWDTTTSLNNWSRSGTVTWFNSSDNVTFADTGVGAVAVAVGGVSAGTVALTNASGTYTFTGGTLTASSLAKSGAGSASFANTLALAGGLALSDGSLTLASTGSLGTSGTTVGITLSGTVSLSNAGTITQSGTGRALDSTVNNSALTVTNSGTITTVSTDAFRVNAANTSVSLTNSGTISVTAGGEAIDWSAIATASNTLTNQVGGLISAVGGDAVRPGMNGSVINVGTITATPTITSGAASGSDGIDLRTQKIVTVTNTGTISGRHGIATDGANTGPSSLTVYNNSGGTILAFNGSGLNVDGVSTAVTATVTNAFGATIQGGVLAAADNGDGDGVDIDGLLTLTNSGDILGYGAKGVGSDTLPNNAQAISIGGGTIINTATGRIIGSTLLADAPNGDDTRRGEGILADNSSGLDAIAATSVTNDGLIWGKTGASIRFVGTLANSITNNASGTIRGAGVGAAIQSGDGNEIVINRGSIIGDNGAAINLEGGDDSLTIEGGAAVITGSIDGGSGTNTFLFDPGTGNSFSHAGAISNFSSLTVQSGTVTLSGTNTNIGATHITGGTLVTGSTGALGSGAITLATGATLNLNGLGLANSITNNGGTIVGSSGSATISQTGGAVSGTLGGTFTASGSVAGAATFTGTLKGTATFTGAVTIEGIHAPGNSPGIETFAAGATYGDASVLEWEFVGDTLAVRGVDFDGVDVTGGAFSVTVGATLKLLAAGVDYSVTDWDSVRTFSIVENSGLGTTSGDFSLDTSSAGSFAGQGTWSVLTASGAGGDTILTWTPVPEPSTYAALAGLAALGLALRRRRK